MRLQASQSTYVRCLSRSSSANDTQLLNDSQLVEVTWPQLQVHQQRRVFNDLSKLQRTFAACELEVG
ncbi:hypothetical protein M514_25344 [Trichuris suis]|uniref:Uncharacterized protein n=1 Tax=Trichuris suis TaxID=68888 RepID=A0A085MBY1_9BILA|nr:hypothetical protein M513_04427 [Trichuris suis]KFD54728.1 hypothetical protein M513_04428 [Trichuris suis]KFD62494.1 hypothetical protein M514_25344 [Trichuris suis]